MRGPPADCVALLLALTACSPEPDYARVHRLCDGVIGQWSPTQPAADLFGAMSERCASGLGEAIGMDWESFGFDPQHLQDSEVGEYTLGGLFVVLASDGRSVPEILNDPFLPQVVLDDLQRIADERGMDERSTSAELWFEFIRESLWSTRFEEALPGKAMATYYPDSRTMTVDPGITFYTVMSYEPLPNEPGSTIIHEASHRVVSPHIACEDGEANACDATPEGAYGVGAWWRNDWSLYVGDPTDAQCEQLDDMKTASCHQQILDSEGWPPCESVCE